MANNEIRSVPLTFVAHFNDAVAYYQGIESMSVDADGTIHLLMSNGQEITYTEIKNQFALLETAFVFQGIINSTSELPANHKKGWLYLVGTAGTYADQTCEVGDLIVCINNGTSSANADWTVIQTNLKPEDFVAKATLSTKFDMLYASAAKTPARLAANTTATRKFLRSGGDSSNNGKPTWDTVTQTDVGLANVNNTSDADKPVSTAQQAALDLKADKTNTVLTGVTVAENLFVGGVTAGSGSFGTSLTAPTKPAGTNSTDVATTAFVMEAFSATDAMIYKGVINSAADFPTVYQKGWTYKIATAGTYKGKVCEVGDMAIANKDVSSGGVDADWDFIQANINGAVTGPASSTNNRIAIFDGTTGKVIKQSSYTAGAAAAKEVDTSITSGSTSANLPTTAAVATYVDNAVAAKTEIDDTAGSGTTNKAWSANKLTTELNLKAPKASPVFTGSISLGRKSNSLVGSGSFAVGSNVEASNGNSHAEGANTLASGLRAHAEGYYSAASGANSHAEGNGTYVTGTSSHAEGTDTIAYVDNQHVGGKYNVGENNLTVDSILKGTFMPALNHENILTQLI